MKKTIFGLLTIVWLRGSWSFACTMIPIGKDKLRQVYDYVVAGTVTNIEQIDDKQTLYGTQRRSDIHHFRYTFSIEQSFKNDIDGDIIIDKKINYLGCDGGRLALGGQYILYVDPIKDSTYYQSSSQQIVYLDDINTLSRTIITKYDLGAPSRWKKITNFFTNLF